MGTDPDYDLIKDEEMKLEQKIKDRVSNSMMKKKPPL